MKKKKKKKPYPRPPDQLTEFQKKFVEEYVSDPKKDGTKAARRAGSIAKEPAKTADVLLNNPKVIKAIAKRRKQLGDLGKPERVLKEIADVAFIVINDEPKFADKLKALDMMCRILAMYEEKKPGQDEDNPLVVKVVNYGDPKKSGK